MGMEIADATSSTVSGARSSVLSKGTAANTALRPLLVRGGLVLQVSNGRCAMKTFYGAVVPALWLIWLAIWLIAAAGAKRTMRRESFGSRLGYGVLMLVGAVLLIKPHILGPTLGQHFHPRSFGWFLAGVTLFAAGLGFSMLARFWLGRNWSGTVTLKQDHDLIRSGPYALVRHPIYSGMLLALIGTAIAIDSWSALIALVAMLAALLFKIRIEERFMADAFGEAYARYRADVPALVPFLF